VEGKVMSCPKCGVLVSLPEGRSGLVHVCEVAYTSVSEVSDHLSVGQEVRVKVVSVDENGRINLSIKKAQEPPPRPPRRGNPPSGFRPAAPAAPASFEDKLKQFMQESDSKISGSKLYADRRSGGRRRK
jgi:S1 RNA binding domain protein